MESPRAWEIKAAGAGASRDFSCAGPRGHRGPDLPGRRGAESAAARAKLQQACRPFAKRYTEDRNSSWSPCVAESRPSQSLDAFVARVSLASLAATIAAAIAAGAWRYLQSQTVHIGVLAVVALTLVLTALMLYKFFAWLMPAVSLRLSHKKVKAEAAVAVVSFFALVMANVAMAVVLTLQPAVRHLMEQFNNVVQAVALFLCLLFWAGIAKRQMKQPRSPS